MSIPDLAGKRILLIPMRADDAELLAKWMGDPANRPHWLGREAKHGDVTRRWNSEFFDDAYPQRGRAFRIEERKDALGAVIHGPVFGSPRNANVELLLAPGVDSSLGEDALHALLDYVFGQLLVRKAWAEVAPEDARHLQAFLAAGFVEHGRTAQGGKLVLMRERPPARAASAKPK